MMLFNALQLQVNSLKDQNVLVVVEGEKDKGALRDVGVTNVITLNKPLFAVVEDIVSRARECVLLTDLDYEGRRLYSVLAGDLVQRGVKINNSFRNFLFRETSLRQIEGLKTYMDRL